jgi:hypothetical protein
VSDRAWAFFQVLLVALVAAWIVQAQDATQPDLDLPVHPSAYTRGATAAPVTTQEPALEPRDEPPPTIYGEEIVSDSEALVYVIDRSGSMLHRDRDPATNKRTLPSRWEKARAELARSVSGLPSKVRFNLIAYDCVLLRLWPATKPASDANKATALAWLEAIEPEGLTATGPATALALSDRSVGAVVLLTDGEPNCSLSTERHRAMIRSANSERVPIHVFGINANSAQRAFCMAVASESGGSYFDVP